MESIQTKVRLSCYLRYSKSSSFIYSAFCFVNCRDFLDLSGLDVSDRERMLWRLNAPVCGVVGTKHLHDTAFNVLQVKSCFLPRPERGLND